MTESPSAASERWRSRMTSAHLRVPRDDGDEPVDLRRTYRSRDVLAVHLDPPLLGERHGMRERELGERRPVVERDAVSTREPGQRAVHRTRVEVAKTEAQRERRRDGALPGPGRAVDGDDHAAGG